MINPCEIINQRNGELFTCESFGRYTKIHTPYLLPDGDVIDLFLRDDGNFHTLTDLGETTRWLRMQTNVSKRTSRQTSLIFDIVSTLGIEFFKGALNIRVDNVNDIAEALTRLGQGCVRVSDVWFTMRSRAGETVTEEVAQFLTENKVEFQQGEKRPGRSGRVWTIDFHTKSPNKNSLVQVLTSGTKDASNRMTEHVVSLFHDLSHLRASTGNGTRFISLFDDTADVWKEEDFKFVESISDVCFWSRPDEFLSAIVA
ncbi:DUF1828 domain-containing protein [Anatilimnocola floriformis]|uniref:DUF1828 domain-containing protein n=1 Tax=Anatilimnocola floriformis TaxID=2948575 RepID=UPI0020C2BC03|nr:DUF1828 domain-containing protein [Anatilimnocola floriformis]